MWLLTIPQDLLTEILSKWCDHASRMLVFWVSRLSKHWDFVCSITDRNAVRSFDTLMATVFRWFQRAPTTTLRMMLSALPIRPSPPPPFTTTHLFDRMYAELLPFYEEVHCVPPRVGFPLLAWAERYPWLSTEATGVKLQLNVYEWCMHQSPLSMTGSWGDYPSLPSVTTLDIDDEYIHGNRSRFDEVDNDEDDSNHSKEWRPKGSAPQSVWPNVTKLIWKSTYPVKTSLRYFPKLTTLKLLSSTITLRHWRSVPSLTTITVDSDDGSPCAPGIPLPNVTTLSFSPKLTQWVNFWLLSQFPHVQTLTLTAGAWCYDKMTIPHMPKLTTLSIDLMHWEFLYQCLPHTPALQEVHILNPLTAEPTNWPPFPPKTKVYVAFVHVVVNPRFGGKPFERLSPYSFVITF